MIEPRQRVVVFDFDGVLADTEVVWGEVRRDVTLESGGSWHEGANSEMQGLSTREWAQLMRDELGSRLSVEEVIARVTGELERRVGSDPPFLAGAVETVRELARGGRTLGVASSSPASLLESMLEAGGIRRCFAAVVSSEEVSRGKPSPDVYLRAAARLSVPPDECLAVEDSSNGLRAAAAAGMEVWAVPNPHDPPSPEALALASRCGGSIAELFGTPAVRREAGRSHDGA